MGDGAEQNLGERRRSGRGRSGAAGAAALALVGLAALALVVVLVVEGDGRPEPDGRADQPRRTDPGRAFSAGSWWNSEVPEDAPTHPHESAILDYLRTAPQNGDGCVRLSGSGDNRWGHPVYHARPSDPEYTVTGVDGDPFPELEDVRIPRGARPARNSDAEMSVYDLERGYVMLFTDAAYDAGSDTWTASGATVTYLDSNGLHAETGRSDDPRNLGTHRGNNGATFAVTWADVRAGEIDHVLKVGSGPEVANRHVFPMVGSDGDDESGDPAVPPQGLRLRIDPDVDLTALDLEPDALVIATALQRYGFYIGDSAGVTELKLENTVVEGRGQLWTLSDKALCDLPFTPRLWDVLAEGYDPGE